MTRFSVVAQERKPSQLVVKPAASNPLREVRAGWTVEVHLDGGEVFPLLTCLDREYAVDYASDRARRLGIEVAA